MIEISDLGDKSFHEFISKRGINLDIIKALLNLL